MQKENRQLWAKIAAGFAGQPRGEEQRPVTAAYKSYNNIYWQQPRDLPPFSFWTVHNMMFDPMVRLCLQIRSAPLYGVQWAYKVPDSSPRGFMWQPGIKAENPKVAEFVEKQLNRIWHNHIHQITRSQMWGWAGGEITLRINDSGQVEFCRLYPRLSQDTRVIYNQRRGVPVGIQIKSVRKQGASKLAFPNALFHSYKPQEGRQYGRSALLGCYSPWADKWLKMGALDVRRLFMKKDAYGGMDIGYPEGSTPVETDGGVKLVENRQIALQIAQQIATGGVIARPSERDPQSGEEMWPLNRAHVPNNPQHILDYPKDLDTEIRHGLEIPDGVIDDDGATGAWGGKKIPMAAFYSGLDEWVISMIGDIRFQVIDHLVGMNFGADAGEYEITHKSLADQAIEQQSESPAMNAGGVDPNQEAQPQPGQDGDGDGLVNEGGPGGAYKQPLNIAPPRGIQSLSTMVGAGTIAAADLINQARQVLTLASDTKESGGRWITIGADEASGKRGWPVKISDSGVMLSGPFRGQTFDEAFDDGEDYPDDYLDEKFRETELADESLYDLDQSDDPKTTEDDAPGVSRSWKRIVMYQAEAWGMDPDDYREIADQVYRDTADAINSREQARKYARRILGMHAGDISRLENQGYDYASTKVKGMDTTAREVAGIFPELGWGVGYGDGSADNDTDLAAKLWELIREGKQKRLSRTSAEFHELVDQQIHDMSAIYGTPGGWREDSGQYNRDVVTMSLTLALMPGATKTVHGTAYVLNRNHRWERADKDQAANKERQGDLFDVGRGDSKGQRSLFDDDDLADQKLFGDEDVKARKKRSKDQKYFRASKSTLEQWAKEGDDAAQTELDRRSTNKGKVGKGKRKIRVKAIRELMDKAEAGDIEALERLMTVDNPNLTENDRDRMIKIYQDSIEKIKGDIEGDSDSGDTPPSDTPKPNETPDETAGSDPPSDTPVTSKSETPEDRLKQIEDMLGADYGYARGNKIEPGTKEFNDLQDERTQLRIQLGKMDWQRDPDQVEGARGISKAKHKQMVEKAIEDGHGEHIPDSVLEKHGIDRDGNPVGQDPKSGSADDGPKDGDRNADGLVFRNGRWRRELPELPKSGDKKAIAQYINDHFIKDPFANSFKKRGNTNRTLATKVSQAFEDKFPDAKIRAYAGSGRMKVYFQNFDTNNADNVAEAAELLESFGLATTTGKSLVDYVLDPDYNLAKGERTAGGFDMEGAPAKAIDQVTKGLAHQLADFPNVKLTRLGWDDNPTKAKGLYYHGGRLTKGKPGPPGRIAFQKKNIRENPEKLKSYSDLYTANKIHFMGKHDKVINDENASDRAKRHAQLKREELQVCKRWTFSTQAWERSIEMTTIHEAAHAIYYQAPTADGTVETTFLRELAKEYGDDSRAQTLDGYEIGEYAGSSGPHEYFTEIATGIAAGFEHELPAKMVAAYKRAIEAGIDFQQPQQTQEPNEPTDG